jgi:hypothetical protein
LGIENRFNGLWLAGESRRNGCFALPANTTGLKPGAWSLDILASSPFPQEHALEARQHISPG